MVSSDNAHVLGVEGRTVQLGFNIPKLRLDFPGSKHEDLLRQVLAQLFGGDWRIEVIVDPSAGHTGGSTSAGQGSYTPPAPPSAPAAGGWGAQPPASQNPDPAYQNSYGDAPPPDSAAPREPSAGYGPPPSAPLQHEAQSRQAPPPQAQPQQQQPGPAASGPFASSAHASATASPPAPPPSEAGFAPAPRQAQPPPAFAAPPPDFAMSEPPPEDEDEPFDPHLAALSDEAAPVEPGPSARDLLIKELGAAIVEERQDQD
jgi:DNA polymerase-3 subunit gamma/tau